MDKFKGPAIKSVLDQRAVWSLSVQTSIIQINKLSAVNVFICHLNLKSNVFDEPVHIFTCTFTFVCVYAPSKRQLPVLVATRVH